MRVAPVITGTLLASVLAASGAIGADLVPATMPDTPLHVPVERLAAAPAIDGAAADWPPGAWLAVPVQPAVEDDSQNRVGHSTVQLRVGVHGERVYFLVRWPDARADTVYKSWGWDGARYRRGKQLDDMLAIRFDLDGDYDTCMLTDREYRVDTWLWSAGRSDLAGHADDMQQRITTRFTENAAEYPQPSGKTVYITKARDAGEPLYRNTRPQRETFQGDTLPGIEVNQDAGGSVGDVAARGTWQDGYWQVELARALDTGHDDDARFVAGTDKRGALAIFDRAGAEHKSASGELRFAFPALR